MNKGKTARLAGFIGALCATGALVGAGVQATGAYFTDSHDGSLSASNGHILVKTTNTHLDFTGLLPGVDKSMQITYRPRDNSANEDVWLVFDSATNAYGAFTGAKGTDYNGHTSGGLGGYGHFKVHSDQGYGFESYNLQLPNDHADGSYGAGYYKHNDNGTCSVNSVGNGGEHTKAVGPTNATDSVPECGVPAAIKLASNISAGHTHTATVTFGLTGKATDQDQGSWADVPFKVVATQVGVSPSAEDF